MKKEDLKASFDRLKPGETAKKRMLDNILNQYEKKRVFYMPSGVKRAIPALAIIVVLAGGLLAYNNLIQGNRGMPNGYNDIKNVDTGREDAAAPILNQFKIKDRHYILLSDDLREDYGLPVLIDEKDIGKKIADVASSPDASLIGSEVYSYIPAGCEAIVAVKNDSGYRLFRFFTFESYNNNQDEDAMEYLKLYGINKAEDIAKIRLIQNSEQGRLQGGTDIIAEITGRDEITSFYGFYSTLKNSSDKYFDALFNFKGMSSDNNRDESNSSFPRASTPELTAPDKIGTGTDMPLDVTNPDETANYLPPVKTDDGGASSGDTPISSGSSLPGSTMVDKGNAGSGTVEPWRGAAGDALANPITIRIYNQNGIYYDSPYYRNIGFISRYELGEDFERFIAKYLDN
ncbi:MAG TPA: hypothetical protein VIL05_06680 [Thermoclostridium sp.]